MGPVAVKKAGDLLFQLCRGERIAERGSARETLPLDLRGQIAPAHNHRRSQTMQDMLFFLDQGSAFFPIGLYATALPLPSGEGGISGLSLGDVSDSLQIMRHLTDIQCP